MKEAPAYSDMIYDCLKNNMQMVSFGDYLRRYIFERLCRKGDYNSIETHESRKILMKSFRETYTSRLFHKTTIRFSPLAEGCRGFSICFRKKAVILSARHVFRLLKNCTRNPECMRGPVRMILLTIKSRKTGGFQSDRV